MVKVLIIEESDIVCSYLAKALSGIATVESCDRCDEILSLIDSYQPDIVVTDVCLKCPDPWKTLLAICHCGRKVQMLLITDILSDYILNRLQGLNPSMILRRPYKMDQLLAQLREMIHYASSSQGKSDDIQELIRDILFSLNINESASGYSCLCAALEVLYKTPDASLSKMLYPYVAEICGGSEDRVERAIRCLIQDAWNKRNRRIWQLYFTCDCHVNMKCPSNREFLSRLAACMRREMQAV